MAAGSVHVRIRGLGAHGDIEINMEGGAWQAFALTTGNNTLTIPSGTRALVIGCAGVGGVQLSCRGIGGDTGFPISRLMPCFIPIDQTAPPANIVINAGANISVDVMFL